jgi:lipoprotein-anchoring transpeptidase ErfK/SrfK
MRRLGPIGLVLSVLAGATHPAGAAGAAAPPPLPPLPAPTKAKPAVPAPRGPVESLVVELSKQRITAFDKNHHMLYRRLVSTGLPATPTPKGDFHVDVKYEKTHMTGRDYHIPVVENVMCLAGDGLPRDSICVHPAPWQEAAGQPFGVARSHGCIRTSSATARWLFNHTDVGTPVTIQY